MDMSQGLCLSSDQSYSWSPSSHFNEERCSPAPRNMKGLAAGRSPPQLCSGHTCGLVPPEDCELAHDHLHLGQDPRPPYLLSPTDSCPLEHHCSPHSSVHSEGMLVPMALGAHVSSSTFPRMHYSSHFDARDDCMGHAATKMNRIPANLLDQFEKQLPLHRDGFHTLQYQRPPAGPEPRSESPGRIRHLVHSVQKLFTKSHSLEGSAKSQANGTKGSSRADEQQHGHHRHSKRSKSRERRPDSKHKTGLSSWWSSDDNLDSDGTYRPPSVATRHHADRLSHGYPEALPSPFGELSLRTSKSNNDVKCSACEGLALTPDAKYLTRSSWSTLTVSQAKEAYRKSSLNLDKPLAHVDLKPALRPCQYLQVSLQASRLNPRVQASSLPPQVDLRSQALNQPGSLQQASDVTQGTWPCLDLCGPKGQRPASSPPSSSSHAMNLSGAPMMAIGAGGSWSQGHPSGLRKKGLCWGAGDKVMEERV